MCSGCGFASETEVLRCPLCDEPMEVMVDLPKSLPARRAGDTMMERYRDFFPFADPRPDLSLGEGFTSLVDMEDLCCSLGLSSLWAKNEGANPTWSFKDRGTLSGVIHAMEMGYDRIGTVSTGNMAASVAAYGARAGIETVVLVNKGLPREKLGPIAIYAPRLIKVDGDYGRLYHESLRVGRQLGIYFINSDSPFRVLGSRTISYEIWEQAGESVPDWVVVPVSAGGNIRGIAQGFFDLVKVGLLDHMPRFLVVQAEGCCPIVRAFEEGAERVRRFDSPHTVAHAIENPFPQRQPGASAGETARLELQGRIGRSDNRSSERSGFKRTLRPASFGGRPGWPQKGRIRRHSGTWAVRCNDPDRGWPQIYSRFWPARTYLESVLAG